MIVLIYNITVAFGIVGYLNRKIKLPICIHWMISIDFIFLILYCNLIFIYILPPPQVMNHCPI